MKKFILNLEVHDVRDKRKALKTVSALPGIDEISMDMKGKKLTIIGTVDPVSVVSKLRKFWPAHIISVGPAKEPEKKEEAKKEEGKKEEAKKDEGKKEEAPREEGKKDEPKKEEGKKDESKKDEPKKEDDKKAVVQPQGMPMPMHMVPFPQHQPYPSMAGMAPPYRPYYPPPPHMQAMPYRPYYPPPAQTYYGQVHHSIEENPNACVIC